MGHFRYTILTPSKQIESSDAIDWDEQEPITEIIDRDFPVVEPYQLQGHSRQSMGRKHPEGIIIGFDYTDPSGESWGYLSKVVK